MFEWFNKELLQQRLLKSAVNLKIYYTIKSVKVNEYTTGWFSQQLGAARRCFQHCFYMNDLVLQIKASSLAV